MTTPPEEQWQAQDRRWRDPAQIASQWEEADRTDAQLLRYRTEGSWWEVIESLGVTVLVSREYEHLLIGLTVVDGRPVTTFMRMPHPSGIAVAPDLSSVHVASTRNPNQVFELAPVSGVLDRAGHPPADGLGWPVRDRPLVPVRSHYLPGCLYLHDLAWIGGQLYGNTVGLNAVSRLPAEGGWELAWWPRAMETAAGRPDTARNYIQLNSIAAGADLEGSYFTASSERISARRPGHANYQVDRRGVLFSGRTREPIASGLTRPHSARLLGDRVWVDNSGYGEVGVVDGGGFEAVAKLPGWTRGLCLRDGIALVGTSRVIPRFRQYAPGLELERSVCGLHAVELESGRVLGSLRWPAGNQVFAVEALPASVSVGFPFRSGRRAAAERSLFHRFSTTRPAGKIT